MISEILSVADDFSYVKIIDTDSLFIKLGKSEDIKARIKDIEDYVNYEMVGFMKMHNMNQTKFISMRVKNEMFVKRIIAHTKKRYVASTFDFEKQKNNVEIKGIEGKRATTKYTGELVGHLIEYAKQESNLIDFKYIFYDVFKKIESSIKSFKIDYISQPINPPRSFGELKSVQSPARGMLNYDILISEVFSKMYAKGLHFPIYISPDGLRSNPNLMDKCKNILKRYGEFSAIKLLRKKKESEEEYIIRYVKDLTVPEISMNTKTVDEINNLGIKIDFDEILKTYLKKFLLIFSPIIGLGIDPNFNFISESKKVRKYVHETYYNI